MNPDPYFPSGDRLYECPECGERDRCQTRTCRCPACGGDMRNLSVARE
ncbi:rubrerythrin-like domain-containing protein [Salinibaculum salinum]